MSTDSDNQDELPILFDVVQPGRTGQQSGRGDAGGASLTDEEMRVLARQVLDAQTEALEEAIVEAIRTALARRRSDSTD